MNKYRIVECLCVLLAVLFIFSSIDKDDRTQKSANEIADSLLPLMAETQIILRENEEIRKTFGFDLSEFESVIHYSCEDIMEVTELFVAVLKEDISQDEIIKVFEDYKMNRYNLFNGYAPLQASLYDSAVIYCSDGAFLFCVGENAQGIKNSFTEILTEVN